MTVRRHPELVEGAATISASADELAAIAAAYLVYAQASAETVPAMRLSSGWKFAARVETAEDVRVARFVAAAASRWSAAGRLDG